MTRARPWAAMIAAKLAHAGLPAALIYLPVIESSYSPWATSRTGAAGLWQLMPETARMLGLTIDEWVDERRDPERSTDAAVRYLGDLYRSLGDWPLALAGYNAGDGRIARAVQATDARARGGAHAFWAAQRALPSETQAYVPKLLAVSRVGSDAGGYRLRLAAPDGVPAMSSVVLPAGTLLAAVARVWGVTPEQVAAWNPALRRPATPPDRDYALRLPAEDVDGRRARLLALPAAQWRLPEVLAAR